MDLLGTGCNHNLLKILISRNYLNFSAREDLVSLTSISFGGRNVTRYCDTIFQFRETQSNRDRMAEYLYKKGYISQIIKSEIVPNQRVFA